MLLVVAIATSIGAGTAFAGPDDAPLELSSKHIGMTGAEVSADHVAVQYSEATAQVGQLSSAADAAEAHAASKAQSLADIEAQLAAAEAAEAGLAEAPVDSEWRTDPSECPPASDAVDGIASYEGCIEESIRGGNGYEESSRICRTLFPG